MNQGYALEFEAQKISIASFSSSNWVKLQITWWTRWARPYTRFLTDAKCPAHCSDKHWRWCLFIYIKGWWKGECSLLRNDISPYGPSNRQKAEVLRQFLSTGMPRFTHTRGTMCLSRWIPPETWQSILSRQGRSLIELLFGLCVFCIHSAGESGFCNCCKLHTGSKRRGESLFRTCFRIFKTYPCLIWAVYLSWPLRPIKS